MLCIITRLVSIVLCSRPFIHFSVLRVSSFSVYSGHQSVLIPPFELESCLSLWLSTLSQYRIRDTFCSYSVMELCTKGLGTQTELLKVRMCTERDSSCRGSIYILYLSKSISTTLSDTLLQVLHLKCHLNKNVLKVLKVLAEERPP